LFIGHPVILGDNILPPAEWERHACADSFFGTNRFGVHRCVVKLCIKRKAQRSQHRQPCRFQYWHYCVIQATKGSRMRKHHERSLTRAWTGIGFPPAHSEPPEICMHALECVWPYHVKENLGGLLATRCNHAAGILCRLPALLPELQREFGGVAFARGNVHAHIRSQL